MLNTDASNNGDTVLFGFYFRFLNFYSRKQVFGAQSLPVFVKASSFHQLLIYTFLEILF